jgi:hypothetical protein
MCVTDQENPLPGLNPRRAVAENRERNGPMQQLISTIPAAPSPLVLCDRLISLAQDADRAGLTITAAHLVGLIDEIFEKRRADA